MHPSSLTIPIDPLGWRYRIVGNRLTRSREQRDGTVCNDNQRCADHVAALVALHDRLVADGHAVETDLSGRICTLAAVWVRGRPGFPPRSTIIRKEAEQAAAHYIATTSAFAAGYLVVLETLGASGVERPSTVLPDWMGVGLQHLLEDRPRQHLSIHDIVGNPSNRVRPAFGPR